MKFGGRAMGKKGVAVILVVGVLVVFILFFLVVAIDFAYVYSVSGQMQNAADAAALAGASQITDVNDTTQTAARDEAKRFASSNFAAREPVALLDNDITVGYWDGTNVLAGVTPVNAVKVVARRLKSRGNPVSLFFGQIVGWPTMDVARVAIAARPPRPTGPMPICIGTCALENSVSPSNRLKLVLQENTIGVNNGTAWSAFDTDPNTPLGPNSNVAKYIRMEAFPPDICGLCITSNNGIGSALQVLNDVFTDPNFDPANKVGGGWNVFVPILNTPCVHPGLSACPPGNQSATGEPFKVDGLARVHIVNVVTTGSKKGYEIDALKCFTCGDPALLGEHPALIK